MCFTVMYKAKLNLCSMAGTIHDLFQASNHIYQLRQTDFVLPRFNTVTSSQYLGPDKLWTNLSSKKRVASNLKEEGVIYRAFYKMDARTAIYTILSFCNRHCNISPNFLQKFLWSYLSDSVIVT